MGDFINFWATNSVTLNKLSRENKGSCLRPLGPRHERDEYYEFKPNIYHFKLYIYQFNQVFINLAKTSISLA